MPEAHPTERRREPRHALSLPVWWRCPGQVGPQHGWMVDVSGHGAAMLTPRHSRPAVGDRLSISLVDPDTGAGRPVAKYLLDRAEVCRLDPVTPSLDRVALHFDGDLWDRDPVPPWEELTSRVADAMNDEMC